MGCSLIYTGIICGSIIFLISDTKIFLRKFFGIMVFFFFIIIIWFFINQSNLLNMFLLYEFFLLPSFYIVYKLSPNRRSLIASIYFLTWTQFGSLLVLAALIKSFYLYGSLSSYNLYNIDSVIIFWLMFIGFGIKIPMWPFYYWLTKTHVEASSFFSMYLSGFLVKTAVYLFSKFYGIIISQEYINLFLVFLFVGAIDSSIKMWHQTDLKKLIAYTTVQEMNLLCIPILWNDSFGEIITSFFIATHCILSCIFFFYIDIITKRFGTRATSQITGLVHTMPFFSFLIFISWVFFSGLPFTIKFLLEIGIFSILMSFNLGFFIFFLLVLNVIGLIGFTKNIFNTLFGAHIINEYIVYDLTKKEIFIYIILLINLIFLNIITLIIL